MWRVLLWTELTHPTPLHPEDVLRQVIPLLRSPRQARSLVVAAKAHRRLLKPLNALELITRRAELGTLETRSGKGAKGVPVEI